MRVKVAHGDAVFIATMDKDVALSLRAGDTFQHSDRPGVGYKVLDRHFDIEVGVDIDTELVLHVARL